MVIKITFKTKTMNNNNLKLENNEETNQSNMQRKHHID